MTPAEWDRVESALGTIYGRGVMLDCDGYKLTLQVVPLKPLRWGIHIFVDGEFKGAWCSARNPSEEQRRFCRRIDRPLHSATDLAQVKRLFSAKQVRDMKAARFTYYAGLWPTFAPLKRHLVANNKVIKRLDEYFSPTALKAAAEVLDSTVEALA